MRIGAMPEPCRASRRGRHCTGRRTSSRSRTPARRPGPRRWRRPAAAGVPAVCCRARCTARENPLVIRAVMQASGLTSLARERPGDLAPMIRAFPVGEPLAGHRWPRGGDGPVTAGHLAVLADRSTAGPLEVTSFDEITGAGWSWSRRDDAMARRLPAGPPRELARRRWQATPVPRPAPPAQAFRRAPAWPGRASGRSRSGTGPAVSGISGHANPRALPPPRHRHRSASTPANSSRTCPWPPRRSRPSGRCHHHRPLAKHRSGRSGHSIQARRCINIQLGRLPIEPSSHGCHAASDAKGSG
jgi:hypothetical protein